MSLQIDRAGNFRGTITQYGLSEHDSGAVSVDITVQIEEAWDSDAGTWEDWRQYDVQALGRCYVVKKDGSLNDSQVKALVQSAGWDGDLTSVVNGTWQTTPCQVVVKEDTYKDETRYRIAFVNDYERTPGGQGNVDPEKAKSLQAKYGSQFRAVAGNLARNAPAKPAGKPQSPPAAKKVAPKPNPETINSFAPDAAASDDEIPF